MTLLTFGYAINRPARPARIRCPRARIAEVSYLIAVRMTNFQQFMAGWHSM
jgi:hypothetical protein